MRGFEPPLSRPPAAHFNRTKLHPDFFNFANIMNIYHISSNIHDKNIVKNAFARLDQINQPFISVGF